MNLDNSVIRVTSQDLDNKGLISEKGISLHLTQTCSGLHPILYPNDAEVLKGLHMKLTTSFPSSIEAENLWGSTSTLPSVFTALYLTLFGIYP